MTEVSNWQIMGRIEELSARMVEGFSRAEQRLEEEVSYLAHMTARRFDTMDGHLDRVECRLDSVEERLDRVEVRLNGVEDQLVSVCGSMLNIRDTFVSNERFEEAVVRIAKIEAGR